LAQGLEAIGRNAKVPATHYRGLTRHEPHSIGEGALDVQKIELGTVLEAALETVRPRRSRKV
jgi:hypothetical protein